MLLNIRNRKDHHCFLYCFTAAWHLKNGPLLYVASRDSIARRTSPDTYSRRNPLAHQAKGEFGMPMGFGQMGFEKLNDCKINVFRYTEKQLVPLRVTRESNDYYILIQDLLRLVSLVKGTTTLQHRVLCRNCFHVCNNGNTYKRRQVSCLQHKPAVVKMPSPEKTNSSSKSDKLAGLHQLLSTSTWSQSFNPWLGVKMLISQQVSRKFMNQAVFVLLELSTETLAPFSCN